MTDTKEMQRAMRHFGIHALEERYGAILPVTGRGIQPGTRVKFSKDGKEASCAIKVTSSGHGRIHFDYDEKAKSWGALSDVDYVLYVRTSQDTVGEFEAHLYDQSTVLGAFDENRKTAVQKGFANLPAWLSAELESKDRFVGSGFAKAAIWKETSSAKATSIATAPTIASPHPVRVAIAAAKDRLAKDLGVASSAIEITVRWS